MSTDDKRIREFAYQIWESEGKPGGQEKRHWEMARKLAEAEALAPSKPPKAASKPAASKTDGAKPAAAKSNTAKPAAKPPRPRPNLQPKLLRPAQTRSRGPHASRRRFESSPIGLLARWEQGLLAKQVPRLLARAHHFIAGRPCSHRDATLSHIAGINPHAAGKGWSHPSQVNRIAVSVCLCRSNYEPSKNHAAARCRGFADS